MNVFSKWKDVKCYMSLTIRAVRAKVKQPRQMNIKFTRGSKMTVETEKFSLTPQKTHHVIDQLMTREATFDKDKKLIKNTQATCTFNNDGSIKERIWDEKTCKFQLGYYDEKNKWTETGYVDFDMGPYVNMEAKYMVRQFKGQKVTEAADIHFIIEVNETFPSKQALQQYDMQTKLRHLAIQTQIQQMEAQQNAQQNALKQKQAAEQAAAKKQQDDLVAFAKEKMMAEAQEKRIAEEKAAEQNKIAEQVAATQIQATESSEIKTEELETSEALGEDEKIKQADRVKQELAEVEAQKAKEQIATQATQEAEAQKAEEQTQINKETERKRIEAEEAKRKVRPGLGTGRPATIMEEDSDSNSDQEMFDHLKSFDHVRRDTNSTKPPPVNSRSSVALPQINSQQLQANAQQNRSSMALQQPSNDPFANAPPGFQTNQISQSFDSQPQARMTMPLSQNQRPPQMQMNQPQQQQQMRSAQPNSGQQQNQHRMSTMNAVPQRPQH